jgi:hypothetical protein
MTSTLQIDERELPPGGEAFLTEINEVIDENYVDSILLFGSAVKGDISDISDIDLIFVLNDAAPDTYGDKLRDRCSALATDHLESSTHQNRFEQYLDRLTGMFQSGFVTTEDAVLNGRFHEIVNTTRLVYWIAPWRKVLAAIFDTAGLEYCPAT